MAIGIGDDGRPNPVAEDDLQFKGAFLTWASVPVSLVLFFYCLIVMGVALSYHPRADWAPLVGQSIRGALVYVPITIGLAGFHSTPPRRIKIVRNAVELIVASCGVATWVWIAAASNPLPDSYRVALMHDTYEVPRHYRPTGDGTWLTISYCVETELGVYGGSCIHRDGYPQNDDIELSIKPITSAFFASFVLQHVHAKYSGDRITFSGPENTSRLPGLVRYEARDQSIFEVDANGLIERFAHCYASSKYCTVWARTKWGNLRYLSALPDAGLAGAWQVDADRWLKRFDAWRCGDPTCGGKFADELLERPGEHKNPRR